MALKKDEMSRAYEKLKNACKIYYTKTCSKLNSDASAASLIGKSISHSYLATDTDDSRRTSQFYLHLQNVAENLI